MIVSGSSNPLIGQVVLQKDHADLAYQMALAFGNKQFESAKHRNLLEFLALNHDRGWDKIDDEITRNPVTGLPFSLVNTPIEQLLLTGPRSVDFNAAHHPYCGILCCMHVWGLFNGRYGLSDKLVVNMLQGEARNKADAMLLQITQRQAELTLLLQNDPSFTEFLDTEKLMQNYKILQFFDTFSLYFNESVAKDNTPATFLNVPIDQKQVASVEVTPLGQKTFRLSPYPFGRDPLDLQHKVFDIPVLSINVDYSKVFLESNWRHETITLVS